MFCKNTTHAGSSPALSTKLILKQSIMGKERKEKHRYLCSAEKNGKVVNIDFRTNRFAVLGYKIEHEKLGRNVSVSLVKQREDSAPCDGEIVRKCDISNLRLPMRKGWSVRVLCLETGEIYDTIRECQRKNNIGNWVVRKVVYEGREFEGKHYKIIDKE